MALTVFELQKSAYSFISCIGIATFRRLYIQGQASNLFLRSSSVVLPHIYILKYTLYSYKCLFFCIFTILYSGPHTTCIFKHYVCWSVILDHNSSSKYLGGQTCFRIPSFSDFRKVAWYTCNISCNASVGSGRAPTAPCVQHTSIATAKHIHRHMEWD